MAMIQVQGLTKDYSGRRALDHIDFSVEKGEVVGFLGPNGAGKTTTMRIITGCLAPTSGLVEIDGRNIFDYPIQTKSKMGYLPEAPPLYEDMYVEDYLRYVGQIKRCHRSKLKDQTFAVMEKTGLTEVKKRLIQNLSKGYRQRVGIASALMADPDVLVLDEPTVGLDPAQVIEIRSLINDLKKNHTVILSTHILSEVEANCEKVIIINEGRLAASGTLSELKQDMHKKSFFVRVKHPSQNLLSSLKGLEGVQSVQEELQGGYTVFVSASDMNQKVAERVINQGGGLLELKENVFSLEDVFIHITKEASQQKG